ncbi:MAG: HEPN domain-containing protein [Anaerovoracaceae bacterium]
MQNENMDRHFTGRFNIDGEEITGELIYNKESGVTLLNLVKQLIGAPLGRSYPDLDVITGVLNSGAFVTLFHNNCTKNHTKAFQTQQLVFVADYTIWSKSDATNKKYNKLVCVLENALEWSGLSSIDTSDLSVIKFKGNENENIYHWFGAKITFSTSLKSELFSLPRKEESTVVERLVVHIETDEKKDTSYFIDVRNKVISLISFAIRDNVNIEEQYLYDYDDSYQIGKYTEYYKHYLYTSEHHLSIHSSRRFEYNFTLGQLLPEKDIQKELALLEPIFNLYLSLFKYTDMPPEMVFLNIVQALETFHARFFYEDSKDKYVASVIERFGSYQNYPDIEKLLLCDAQKDENCKYIILVSRLNDLLIGKYDGLFWDYYGTDAKFAQAVADTRHYYTHYGKSKEKKALKGDKLIDAISVLSLLLEYNICLQLGIDNQAKVRTRLSSIASWKQFQSCHQKESKQKK